MTTTTFMFVAVHHVGHATAPPGGIGYFAPVLLLFALVCIGIFFVAYRALNRGRGGDEPTDGYRGRRGPEGDPTPPGPAPNNEPDWWPQFELEFATYVREADRALATTSVR